ncbi:NACHT domain-containing protein [Streptomyces sp. CRN 30]|uniref:NACHT domain-containing protein n=1 Tax=Streptomyces sp. CRN 30 TaxID=3075613 RepID=UPI002A8414B3|nr:NACHT domain-containing protein [Streptomyces sp. CRN 30]
MEPVSIGARLASSIVVPLVKRLFVVDGPGAGLVDRPVRVSSLVSFRGEKRTLSDADLHKIAEELVDRATQSTGMTERLPGFEQRAVVNAVAHSLGSLGHIDMDDVQVVRLGHLELSRNLRAANQAATRGLSSDAVLLHARVMDTACLHILHFFTTRSTFVPRTLAEQSRRIEELSSKIDVLLLRTPSPADGGFEQRYAGYISGKYGRLTIFGLDLSESSGTWSLDAAYLSLEATESSTGDLTSMLPAEQVLARHDRVLLRGVAGSGKTTLVQWLAVSAGPDGLDERLLYLHGLVPFVLPMRSLTRAGARLPGPDEFLSAVGCPIAHAQPTGWYDRVLTAGRGLLLVDGIDEMPEAEREEARTWLRDLVDAYPRNHWLVTSRPSAVREHWLAAERFRELDLAPMSRDDVASFIRRWHKAAGSADSYRKELLYAIRAKQELARLATNPLMCALICALHRDRRGYLPDGRKELYDAALSMLLSRRDRERGVYRTGDLRIGETHQVQLIQKLAYWLIRNGRSEMATTDVLGLLAQALTAMPRVAALGSVEQIYRHLLVRSGLLLEPVEGSMQFIHRTFQDYLGARAAVESLDFDFLGDNAHLDQWEDVLRMAVAHARPAERTRLLTGLIERGDACEDTRHRLHLLAAACLEDATELSPAARAEVQRRAATLIPPHSVAEARALADVGPVVLELLRGPAHLTPDEAYHTVLTAVRIGTDAAIPVLSRFRTVDDLRIRTELALAWSRFDTDRYAEEVIAHLGQDELYFAVSSGRELMALRRLGGRSLLKITAPLTVEEMKAHCVKERLTGLCVAVDPGWSWSWLAGFSRLTELTLETALPEIDVGSLRAVPSLRTLRLPEGARTVGADLLSPAVEIVRAGPAIP